MAIPISSKPNTELADPAYLLGRYKDDSGIGDGTPLNLLTHGDYVQFFLKLLQSAGITANGLPDNTTNGFQLYTALGNWQDGSTTITATPDSGTVTIQPSDVQFNKFMIQGKNLVWQVYIQSASITGSPTEIMIDFPPALITLLGSAFIANNNAIQLGYLSDAGTDAIIYVKMDVTQDAIILYRDTSGGTPFSAGTNNQSFHWNLTIPIN